MLARHQPTQELRVSATEAVLDPEFLEHGLRLEIGGPERDGLAVPERPVVNNLYDRVGPGNADVDLATTWPSSATTLS